MATLKSVCKPRTPSLRLQLRLLCCSSAHAAPAPLKRPLLVRLSQLNTLRRPLDHSAVNMLLPPALPRPRALHENYDRPNSADIPRHRFVALPPHRTRSPLARDINRLPPKVALDAVPISARLCLPRQQFMCRNYTPPNFALSLRTSRRHLASAVLVLLLCPRAPQVLARRSCSSSVL
ncbi:hypothetical protein DFH09DRAFT_1146617 [Mycena vulgaris]|nr:hypothetical protein DFH09DRAFT_1146617 [Mycena vulgaris]